VDKSGFPGGNPEEDREKLRLWWHEEMRGCGLSAAVTVEYAPLASETPSWSPGKHLVEALVTGRSEVVNTRMYRSAIPGAAWPLDAVVVTTDSGMITQVVYWARLKRAVSGEVRFRKSLGLFGRKLEVEGPGGHEFRDRRDLLKTCKEGLCLDYEPPLRGFHASKKRFELKEAMLAIRPAEGGSEALVVTTVRDEAAFVGRKYSLGLAKVLDVLRAVEQT
jgi:hypothetical protein